MLELGYYLLTLIVLVIIVFSYRYGLKKMGLEKDVVNRRSSYLVLGLLIWIAYVYFISKSGFLANFSLPPRFPLFLIVPLFTFTGIILYKNRDSKIFKVLPNSWAIYIQSFRIAVEILFVATLAKGYLHKEVTIEGYNFDMIFAFTAPIIGYLVFKSNVLSKKIALFWNYLGLAVLVSIIFVFTTTTYTPSIWGSEISLAPLEMVSFPYILIAAFLMPVAVFVHLFSIIQLRKS